MIAVSWLDSGPPLCPCLCVNWIPTDWQNVLVRDGDHCDVLWYHTIWVNSSIVAVSGHLVHFDDLHSWNSISVPPKQTPSSLHNLPISSLPIEILFLVLHPMHLYHYLCHFYHLYQLPRLRELPDPCHHHLL